MKETGFENFIITRSWKFAKTMPQNPHEYTRRNGTDTEFDNAVLYIRENGKPKIFNGRKYLYFNKEPFTYWTMGNPINETILINRAELIKE